VNLSGPPDIGKGFSRERQADAWVATLWAQADFAIILSTCWMHEFPDKHYTCLSTGTQKPAKDQADTSIILAQSRV